MTDEYRLLERAGLNGVTPSPFCWRVRLALVQKNVSCNTASYQYVEGERLKKETAADVIPVLVHGEATLSGSQRIADYLDKTIESDPLVRPEDAQLIARIETDFVERVIPLVVKDAMKQVLPDDREYFRQMQEQRQGRTLEELEAARDSYELDLAFSLGRLEKALSPDGFFAGDAARWADILVYCHLLWISVASPRSWPVLSDDLRTWWDDRDASWRSICLEARGS